MQRASFGIITFCIAIVPSTLLAHHSRAEFSGETTEIEGELVAVRWLNPHPYFTLRPSGSSREDIEVQVFGSIGTLNETGVEQSMFTVGERITVAGRFSRRRSNLILGTHALLESGLEAVLQYNAEPHWSGERVGGLGMTSVDESILARATAANRGIFRVWSTPSTAEAVAALQARNPSYTEAALAAREQWDLTDNPMTRCEPSWMPHVMVTPTRRSFIDNGDTLTLNVMYMNSSRTIYLGDVPDSVDRTPSRMGLSVGRWEGNTLIVETSGIDAPAYDGDGTLQSPEMRVVERFSLSEDQATLDYEAVMTDPIAFNAPVVFRLRYLALEQELGTGCRPGGQ